MESVCAFLQYLVHAAKNATEAFMVLVATDPHCRAVCDHLDLHQVCRAFRTIQFLAPCRNGAVAIPIFSLPGIFIAGALCRETCSG